jgi:hypothetical protein
VQQPGTAVGRRRRRHHLRQGLPVGHARLGHARRIGKAIDADFTTRQLAEAFGRAAGQDFGGPRRWRTGRRRFSGPATGDFGMLGELFGHRIRSYVCPAHDNYELARAPHPHGPPKSDRQGAASHY